MWDIRWPTKSGERAEGEVVKPGWVVYNGYTRAMALRSVGPGWVPLVMRLWDWLEQTDPQAHVVQVKEKFGGLRVYIDFSKHLPPGGHKPRYDIEAESFRTCEWCGRPGEPRYDRHWIKTLCDECRAIRLMPDPEGAVKVDEQVEQERAA